ncbi:MAG: sugar ABC transporter substrate-binding protein [Clostridiales bacterium]|nr:sugar ABC transporter substrate-binding protein [Clostridiales bacterium]
MNKKVISAILCTALAVTLVGPVSVMAEEGDVSGKTIGYYMDAADDYYKCAYEVFMDQVAANEETQDWDVRDIVGQGTSQEQLSAVEDFITAGVDAIIVVQNSPEITAECITKANEAGIPYFAMTHAPSVPAGGELAGFSGYDFVYCGKFAGEDALAHGVTKLINIEGKLGQGTASAQSLGFLKAYEEAGKDIGGTAEEVASNKTEGGPDLQIVQWDSGGWWSEPAKAAMANAITALGADGWDGAYVHNDEMMDGVIQAIEEAGLDSSNYWLGSSNGKEKSWKWVEEGKETMDVNQTPSLEGDVMYQIVVNYFKTGESKYVIPYVTPYNNENVTELTLIPYDHEAYAAIRDQINTDIFSEDFGDATDLINWN